MSGDEDRDESFAEAMRGVKPLEDREKLRPRPGPAAQPRRSKSPPRRFVVERRGSEVLARREDVAHRQLADLRAGQPAPERELDLHGLTAREARRELLACLERARREGVRCLLVIHGEGHHSRGDPVLKGALPEWLQQEAAVLAFATAPPRAGGGAGATLVLLRREKRPR